MTALRKGFFTSSPSTGPGFIVMVCSEACTFTACTQSAFSVENPDILRASKSFKAYDLGETHTPKKKVTDNPARDGKIANLFYSVRTFSG